MNETSKVQGTRKEPKELPQRPGAQNDSRPQGSHPQLMTATTLTGTRVLNRKDETLGTISDVVLNVEHGSIAYAVMASGGFMGVGERLYVLPWDALALDAERQCCVLNAEKTTLDDMPGFDKDHWPESPFQQKYK